MHPGCIRFPPFPKQRPGAQRPAFVMASGIGIRALGRCARLCGHQGPYVLHFLQKAAAERGLSAVHLPAGGISSTGIL